MGWYYSPMHNQRNHRKYFINELIRDEDNEDVKRTCLAHCARGNVLWTVWEVFRKKTEETIRYIGCDILSFGGEDHGWGNKPLDESCGVNYYTCPKKYLKMVPCPDSEYARQWREEVERIHSERRSHRGAIRASMKQAGVAV